MRFLPGSCPGGPGAKAGLTLPSQKREKNTKTRWLLAPPPERGLQGPGRPRVGSWGQRQSARALCGGSSQQGEVAGGGRVGLLRNPGIPHWYRAVSGAPGPGVEVGAVLVGGLHGAEPVAPPSSPPLLAVFQLRKLRTARSFPTGTVISVSAAPRKPAAPRISSPARTAGAPVTTPGQAGAAGGAGVTGGAGRGQSRARLVALPLLEGVSPALGVCGGRGVVPPSVPPPQPGGK